MLTGAILLGICAGRQRLASVNRRCEDQLSLSFLRQFSEAEGPTCFLLLGGAYSAG